MSKWREIRCDFFNEEEEKYYVEAWKTGNDNEEGKVIAKIDLADGTVEYLDEDARTDEDAQTVINEFLENGYVLTEQSRNNDFLWKGVIKMLLQDNKERQVVLGQNPHTKEFSVAVFNKETGKKRVYKTKKMMHKLICECI